MIHMHYKKLHIWQKGIQLVLIIDDLTENFPNKEIYTLTKQMRGSAASIPTNIAEGSQRTTVKDFANFVLIAKGSLAELETQRIIATHRRYLSSQQSSDVADKIEELDRMLFAFYKKLTS